MGNLREYVKDSSQTAIKKQKEIQAFGGSVYIFIKDPFTVEINFVSVLKQLEKMVPSHLVHNLDCIFVGQFEELEQREVQAVYLNGTIYVTNEQENEEDLLNDLLHETAHAAEELADDELYSDGELEREFLAKREKLFNILYHQGYTLEKSLYMEPDLNQTFDNFLYKEVGYNKLAILTSGLFLTPYAATSLSEYFANGYEHYLMGEQRHLKDISPVLYNKVEEIVSTGLGEINEYD